MAVHLPPAQRPILFQGEPCWTVASESPPCFARQPSAACRRPNTSWKVSEDSGHWPCCLGLTMVPEERGERVEAELDDGQAGQGSRQSHCSCSPMLPELNPATEASGMPGRQGQQGLGSTCEGVHGTLLLPAPFQAPVPVWELSSVLNG